MVAFDPAGRIRDQGETGSMALRETVTPETFDLLEGLLGERLAVAVGDHSLDHLLMEGGDAAVHLEGRHAPAQGIGLGWGEAGADDRHLHRLLLEQRHAQRLAENLPELWCGV